MKAEQNMQQEAKYVSYKTLKLLWKMRRLEQDKVRDTAKGKLVK